MRQILLPDFTNSKLPITLSANDTHYLKNVLRFNEDAIFCAIDNSGKIWDAKILKFRNKNAVIALLQKRKENFILENSLKIVLYQSLLKGKKMDSVVRQAAEAGVSCIAPLETEFSIGRLEKTKSEQNTKTKRWEKICKEAMQQSGSSVVTKIADVQNIMDLHQHIKNTCIEHSRNADIEPDKTEDKEITIFFHQENIDNKLLHNFLFNDINKINIIIGPEGGFSKKETDFMRECGYFAGYLGRNVLRAETAAIYSIAAIKTIFLERGAWKLC